MTYVEQIRTIVERDELSAAGFTSAEIDRLFVYRAAVAAGYFNESMPRQRTVRVVK